MKKMLKMYHFLIIYPLLWIIYCIFELISGNITNLYHILMNLIPAIILVIISYLFFLYYKNFIMLKNFNLSIVILILFLIDQLSKIIISIIFSHNNMKTINIIKDYFSITPYINDQGSFIASRFNINAPFLIFILLNFVILMLIFFVYKFKLEKNQINSIEQLAFIFLFSGGLCSLIDKIFWGGSLDFLEIHNLFIADIKDIFITFGLGSFILSNIICDSQIDLKDFGNFILKSLKIK